MIFLGDRTFFLFFSLGFFPIYSETFLRMNFRRPGLLVENCDLFLRKNAFFITSFGSTINYCQSGYFFFVFLFLWWAWILILQNWKILLEKSFLRNLIFVHFLFEKLHSFFYKNLHEQNFLHTIRLFKE